MLIAVLVEDQSRGIYRLDDLSQRHKNISPLGMPLL
jgi:hypothetical protein